VHRFAFAVVTVVPKAGTVFGWAAGAWECHVAGEALAAPPVRPGGTARRRGAKQTNAPRALPRT
jgi:hypothetical protein